MRAAPAASTLELAVVTPTLAPAAWQGGYSMLQRAQQSPSSGETLLQPPGGEAAVRSPTLIRQQRIPAGEASRPPPRLPRGWWLCQCPC